jgi:hypothetical protein
LEAGLSVWQAGQRIASPIYHKAVGCE